jgi:uncharacterized membrane protein
MDPRSSVEVSSSRTAAPKEVRASRAASRSGTVAKTAIFTAFVAATTVAFSVYIPATRGYFNIGEAMVYTTALLMGPYVGAFAGGVGSAMSDAILAPVYAPGTLAIKGLEGFLVGYLSNLSLSGLTRRKWLIVSSIIGVTFAALVAYVGVSYLSGPKSLYLGLSYCAANCSSVSPVTVPLGPQFSADFDVPWIVWGAAAIGIFSGVLWWSYRTDEKLGWTLVSVLIGGTEMVVGYFLYESTVLRLGVISAGAEVPVNIGQVIVGVLVAVPLVRGYRRATRRVPFQSGEAKV